MARPVSRLRLLLPDAGPARTTPGRVPEATDIVARAIADALAGAGVQARQQVAGSGHDGSPRADVALWLPDPAGHTPSPDPKNAPARVHAALVVDPASSPRALGRYDAVLVPYERLVPAVREAANRAARPPVVVAARLAGLRGDRDVEREAERAERGLAGRRVVVIDVRAHTALAADLERAVVQLALRTHDAAVVLVVSPDELAQRRVRDLCARHAVDAWLAVGHEGFAAALAIADFAVATPSWDEVFLAALTRTPFALAPPSSPSGACALAVALRDGGVVDDMLGTLQLAAVVDRRLFDAGALAARGVALSEALLAAEKPLYDVLASLEPLPGTHGVTSRWEAIGPHAQHAQLAPAAAPPVVAAKDVTTPLAKPTPSPAQQIEDDLAALKAKLALGGGSKPGGGA